MLSPSKLKLIEDLIASSSREELAWMNGYISGILANAKPEEPAVSVKSSVNKITIAYGTETGNSKKLAADFAARAKKAGIAAKLVGLDQYRLNDLPKEEYFLTIVSTQGEGDPPAAAKKFYDHIHNNGFKLEKLKYGVLALGDTSYPLFCKAGEDVDAQLNKLGGQRLVPLQKCDTDYNETAESWFNGVLQHLSAQPQTIPAPLQPRKKISGKKIYKGVILNHVNLNDKGSAKQTYHIEIGAEDLNYLPGDSLGIVPENDPATVEAILKITGVASKEEFPFRGEPWTAIELLKRKLQIVYLPERVVNKYARLVDQDIPVTRISLLDLLKIYPLKNAGQFHSLLELLEPMVPRLYSISSSPEAHSGEVHITVSKDSFCVNEEWKSGLCSGYLSQFQKDAEIEFYIHHNHQFKLPDDGRDVVMIGPGTGIAPFRSFLAQRDAVGAAGRNWLFFGEQHFVTDFLYQTEIQSWLDTGVLTRIDVAFSRDQKEKLYVQHKMLRRSEELFSWINNGASVYVCGKKDPMSLDVDATLVQILQQHSGKSSEEATAWLGQLSEEGRYVKDVY
ncbi:MAG: sulfite reductase flavoprotein subunit alpha [Flavisolibacter sp.]